MKISSRPEDLFGAFGLLFVAALVKRGVDRVEVFAVEVVLSNSQGIANTVNMKHYNLPNPFWLLTNNFQAYTAARSLSENSFLSEYRPYS